MCMYGWSLCCSPETSTTLLMGYTPIQNKKLKKNRFFCVPPKVCWPFSSVQFSHSVMSNSLRPHESQHARPPCPSPTPGVHSNSHPSSQWCHPAISSSVVPFSSCPQSLPVSESFPMSQLFAWSGQRTGVSIRWEFLGLQTQEAASQVTLRELLWIGDWERGPRIYRSFATKIR